MDTSDKTYNLYPVLNVLHENDLQFNMNRDWLPLDMFGELVFASKRSFSQRCQVLVIRCEKVGHWMRFQSHEFTFGLEYSAIQLVHEQGAEKHAEG